MRFHHYKPLAVFAGAMLLMPSPAPAAASKEMQDLQRDVAQLSDQVTSVQKSIAATQGSIQQALDIANKTNSSVNSLNSGVIQTIQNAVKGLSDQLAAVNGLSAKVSGIAEDVSNLSNSQKDMQAQINRQGEVLNDILNRIKLLQVPAVAPPPSTDAAGPPPSPGDLFNNAKRDQDSGRFDLAITEYQKFLDLYPNDGNAIRAQYNMGATYYSAGKPEDAVKALDAAIERYPEDPSTTPSALYMKGMAYVQLKDKARALASFKAVVSKYPHAPEASQSETQIRSLGPATTPGRKR